MDIGRRLGWQAPREPNPRPEIDPELPVARHKRKSAFGIDATHTNEPLGKRVRFSGPVGLTVGVVSHRNLTHRATAPYSAAFTLIREEASICRWT